MNIVLVSPEIPSNTGNIGRTCLATGASLHLVGPLGFQLSNKQLKRAGLDYWPQLDYKTYTSWEKWSAKYLGNSNEVWFFSTRGRLSFYKARFAMTNSLVFGSETRGLPDSLLKAYSERTLFLPMTDSVRSLNLANTVAIALYEALRQVKSL